MLNQLIIKQLKKLSLLFCCLVLQAVAVNAQKPPKVICPPPCKGVQSNIFFDKFCCKKTKQFKWECLFFEWDDTQNKCIDTQNAIVQYWNPNEYYPWDPVAQANQDSKQSAQSTYICPTLHKKAVSWKYIPDSAGFHLDVFDKDTVTILGLDSHLPYDLSPRDPLVKEATKNMLDYVCNYFDAKDFFQTQKAPPFQHTYTTREEMPESGEASSTDYGVPPSQRTNSSEQEKSIQTHPTRSSSQSGANIIPPASRVATVQKAPEGAQQMFDIFFYAVPTPGHLSTVRHFRTADKQQELKVNFSSGSKSKFLQKLEKQFPKESSQITHCKNGNTLFETQQAIYQIFILSPNAISVLVRPEGFPANESFKKQLCDFNASSVW